MLQVTIHNGRVGNYYFGCGTVSIYKVTFRVTSYNTVAVLTGNRRSSCRPKARASESRIIRDP
jgi:hypothetical protein